MMGPHCEWRAPRAEGSQSLAFISSRCHRRYYTDACVWFMCVTATKWDTPVKNGRVHRMIKKFLHFNPPVLHRSRTRTLCDIANRPSILRRSSCQKRLSASDAAVAAPRAWWNALCVCRGGATPPAEIQHRSDEQWVAEKRPPHCGWINKHAVYELERDANFAFNKEN